VVHVRDPEWSALELGAMRTLSNGSKGGSYHHIPRELPGIFLGRLGVGAPGRKKSTLVRVLWMGRVFLCSMSDLARMQ
jgi:hypothetical protein